jgi:hypothetical protein
MKYFLSLLVIISFIGIGVFGFIFSDMGLNHQGGCVASAINGTECPTNIVDFGAHHISALRTLTTTAVPPISNWFLLIAFLLLISVSIFLFYKNLLFPKSEFLRERLRNLESNFLYSKQKTISWLSLFELSPTL